ncbi:MAG: hypothetical protein WCP57_01215 [Bacteroidota bacterium]
MKKLRIKIAIILLIATTLSVTISSCHRTSCPTYSGSKGFR